MSKIRKTVVINSDIRDQILTCSNRSKAIRELLEYAYCHRLKPVSILSKGTEQVLLGNDIITYASEFDLSDGFNLGGLAASAFKAKNENNRLSKLSTKKNNLPDIYTEALKEKVIQHREEQLLLLSDMLSPVSLASKVNLHEAGTGIGKSIAAIITAIEMAKNIHPTAFEAIYITAPTHIVGAQILNAYEKFRLIDQDLPFASQFFGIQEFVSENSLIDMLEEGNLERVQFDAINKWMNSTTTWLASELEFAANINLHATARLNQNCPETDKGMIQFQEHLNEIVSSKIIVCSHVKFAHLIKQKLGSSIRKTRDEMGRKWETFLLTTLESAKKKNLPAFILRNKEYTRHYHESVNGFPTPVRLIVDEAHLLKAGFKLAYTQSISLWSLKRRLNNSKCPLALKKLFEKLYQSFTNYQGALNSSRQAILQLTNESKLITEIAESLSRYKKKDSDFTEDEYQFRLLSNHIRNGQLYNKNTRINYSPCRQYPTIDFSDAPEAPALDFMYRSLESTHLLSSTLSTRAQDNSLNTKVGADILGYPIDISINNAIPIHPKWLFSNVQIYIPSINSAAFLFPTDRKGILNPNWLETTAKLINESAREDGGTLVLMTSYDAIENIKGLLDQDIQNQLILATDRQNLHSQAELYRQRCTLADSNKEYRYPVWLALGGAWQGLDISKGGESDHWIRNLIITRFPLYSPPSEKSYDIGMSINKAALTLRQGVGRIKRTPDQPHKTIWILDGRWYEKAFRPFRQILREYTINQTRI